MDESKVPVRVNVNGEWVERSVDDRLLLVDFLRQELRLTGTHIGCAHGVCGACTVLIDDRSARSCLAFAAQMDGHSVRTVDSLASDAGLSDLQQSFHEHHALQCGFCTPGVLMAATDLLARNPAPSESEIRQALAGNLCRCTGYVNIVKAVAAVAGRRSDAPR